MLRLTPTAHGPLRVLVSLAPAACALLCAGPTLAQSAPMPPQPGAYSQQPGAPPSQPGAYSPQQPPPQGQPGYPPPYGYGPYYPPPGYYYPPPQGLPPAPAPLPMRRNNTAMMVGGILLTGAGAVGLIVGTVMNASANERYEIYCDDGGYSYQCEQRTDEGLLTASWVTMIASGVGLGVGITFWVIGGRRVPITEEPPQPAAFQPTLSVGVGSASMKMAF